MYFLLYVLIVVDITLILANEPYFYLTNEKSIKNSEYLQTQLLDKRVISKRSADLPLEVNVAGPADPVVPVLGIKLQTNVSTPVSNSQLVKNNPNGEYSVSTFNLSEDDSNSTINRRNSALANETSVVPEDVSTEMLRQHNITSNIVDSHIYYNSSITYDPDIGKNQWIEVNNKSDTVTHEVLSQSYRRAVTVPLPFKFPFYGHKIENVTIATGGFLYTGDFIHSWLAATQFIAPLMANFDTSLSNDSLIKYVSSLTTFTVLWEKVALRERPSDGNFTFEVTLYKSGDIIFNYKEVPDIIFNVTEDLHPVKVGLSDAYILERNIFFTRRKTIFEYHHVHFDRKHLRNWTMIHLIPSPTCLNKTTCESCLSKDTQFECQWCDNRCSTGVDRKRQDWMKKECEKKKVNETKYCNLKVEKQPVAGAHKLSNSNERIQTKSSSVKFAVFSFIVMACLVYTLLWTVYAYQNPHSTSGQILIRYRPSQWSSWRKGEARYTAATIHM